MNYDYTFCVSDCENENCFRHKSKILKGIPVSMAMLKGTPECELARAEHGYWIDGENMNGEKFLPGIKYCSACHKEAYWDSENGQQLFPYCPNCGTKMEKNEEVNRMNDLINRQDAINLLKKWADGYNYIETDTELAIKEFQRLPSAQL